MLPVYLTAIAGILICSCNKSDKEDPNATIVDVEKGAVSPVWTPEADMGVVNTDVQPADNDQNE